MTKKQIYLPIVFHFHQPVDQKGFIYEDIYQKSYMPLIDNIFHYENIKFTLHFSGNLLEWFLENKPDFIEKIKVMAKRGQIEIIGGGYYEPIFAVIPYFDRIAQINKLSDLIKKEFGLEVKGAWLSERVWEPSYPSFLNGAGLKYVIVDDNHFRSTGITEKETFYSYTTEDEGKTLRIFPINEVLRYLTPWEPTYMSIEYLKNAADEEGDRIALLISDAEKMGVWGITHQICYVEGKGHEEGDEFKPFIPALFDQITKNKWIKTITLSEYMEKYPAKSLIYLPTASYDKMEAWVLPTKVRKVFEKIREKLREDQKTLDEYLFLKGGFWRYFLIKYPESNYMHKKMLHVRDKLIRVECNLGKLASQESKEEANKLIEKAWDEIYKSQCNDCYWHGLFGGVYLQFLRFSVYTHLINSEVIIDDLNTKFFSLENKYISITLLDFNKDSRMDIIIESDLLNLYINPFDGGTIFELDYKPKSYNLLNTLTRWTEAYHDDEDIDKNEVMVDRFKRSMLRVRFYHNDEKFKAIEADQYKEYGSFVNSEFNIIKNEKNGNSAQIVLEQKGNVLIPGSNDTYPCSIIKKIKVEENQVKINLGSIFEKISGREESLKNIITNLNLGIDLPFFFNGDPNNFQWESNQLENLKELENELLEPFKYTGCHLKAQDLSYKLTLEYSLRRETKLNTELIEILKFPIVAYAFTDEGYKTIYQGINVIPKFKLQREMEIEIEIKIY